MFARITEQPEISKQTYCEFPSRRCDNGTVCITVDRLCNNITDCADESDENGDCSKYIMKLDLRVNNLLYYLQIWFD